MDMVLNSHNPKSSLHEKTEQKIEKVIEKRQSLVKKVQPICQHLNMLLQEVGYLKQQSHSLKNLINDSQVRESLENINFAQLEANILAESASLQQLVKRLSRKTLNIGVVGRMRQGKSTFLQRLSGLSNQILPARPGGACTAVRSKIYHHDGETRAAITLHSENSFLQEVIAPYYKSLGLGTPPKNLDEFANSPFPYVSETGAARQAMYEHLYYDYYLTLPQYRSFLKSTPQQLEILSEEVIASYVAPERNKQGHLNTFNHLAVREVEIYCQFDRAEVNQLGLIDIPGLGDLRLGDEELILSTLRDDVDAVLFIRRPDPTGDDWQQQDVALYDLAARALPNLAERAFIILNHVVNEQDSDKDNWKDCERFRGKVGNMKVVQPIQIANCDENAQANQILLSVLQYLEQNIQRLEEQHAQSCQNSLHLLHQGLDLELKKIGNILRISTNEYEQFQILFDKLMQDIANGLRDLVEELQAQQDTIDADFQVAVQKVLEECEKNSGIPSVEDVKNRCRTYYHNSYKATYCVCIAELRSHLAMNFLALENGLQQTADQLKKQVAKVLVEKANLGGLTDARGTDFLRVMEQLLTERGSSLATGFHSLVNFKIDYEELIMNWIQRDLMSVLNPDSIMQNHELMEIAARAVTLVGEIAATVGAEITTPLSPSLVERTVNTVDQLAVAVINNFFELNPETIHQKLQALHRHTIDKCTTTLGNWLNGPSRIRYAMATQFLDCILDAKPAIEQWDTFLRDPEIRVKVWQEFTPIEQLREFLADVQRVAQLNQRDRLFF